MLSGVCSVTCMLTAAGCVAVISYTCFLSCLLPILRCMEVVYVQSAGCWCVWRLSDQRQLTSCRVTPISFNTTRRGCISACAWFAMQVHHAQPGVYVWVVLCSSCSPLDHLVSLQCCMDRQHGLSSMSMAVAVTFFMGAVLSGLYSSWVLSWLCTCSAVCVIETTVPSGSLNPFTKGKYNGKRVCGSATADLHHDTQ